MRDAGVPIDVVLEIDVPDDEIVRRLSGRRVHLDSGRVYHVEFNPPAEEGKDDVTGEALVQRDDDKEATVRKRLSIYHEQTKPLVDFYSDMEKDTGDVKYIRIDGTRAINQIVDDIKQSLGL